MAEAKWSEYDFWLKNAAAKALLKSQDEKKYSAQIKRVLKHTGEQTEHVRDLSKAAEHYSRESADLKKELRKGEGPAINGKVSLPPGYWMPEAIAERRALGDEWNENYDRWDELKTATEEAPFNMTALWEAAVREYGMPNKRTESRGALLTQEAARRLLQARGRQ